MSDAEVLEELIERARNVKARLVRLSDAALVYSERFLELGRALKAEGGLRAGFPFEDCDVAEVKRILEELPELRSELSNLEHRIKRRTALE